MLFIQGKMCAIQVLAELELAKAAGKRVSVTELGVSCGLGRWSVAAVMSQFRRKQWVEVSVSGSSHYIIIDLTGAAAVPP